MQILQRQVILYSMWLRAPATLVKSSHVSPEGVWMCASAETGSRALLQKGSLQEKLRFLTASRACAAMPSPPEPSCCELNWESKLMRAVEHHFFWSVEGRLMFVYLWEKGEDKMKLCCSGNSHHAYLMLTLPQKCVASGLPSRYTAQSAGSIFPSFQAKGQLSMLFRFRWHL